MIDRVLKEPSLKDIDIVVKCKKYPEFRKELQEIQKAYSNDHNMSIYINLDKLQQGKYFQILRRDKLYINFYGYKMSQLSQSELNKVYLLWIMKMDDEIRANIKQRYSIIYFNTLATSEDPFIFIRDSFKKLPIQYYALVDKIYVVEPNFMIRNSGVLQFGRLFKLYSRRLHFVENLKDLSKIEQIKKNQIMKFLPQIILKQQTSSEKKKEKEEKDSKKETIANEIVKLSMQIKPKIEEKKDCLTIRLSRHKFDTNLTLPIHLLTLIQTMRKYPEMMQLQGIFRKSGSIQEQQEIIVQLGKMEVAGILSQTQTGPYSGYAIAGVIKKIFTKLSEPIVPYTIYNKIMCLQEIQTEDQLLLVKDIIYSLPQANRKTLLYLIVFIKNEVLVYEQNKMTFYNMSVVLAPCFFRSELSSLQDLLKAGRYASIVNILFQKLEEIIEPGQNNWLQTEKPDKQKRGSRNSNNGSLQPKNTNIM